MTKMIMRRPCALCGQQVAAGMTDLEGFYAHEKCFEAAMDKRYGVHMWLAVDPDGYYAHYTGDGVWEDTGIFWTDFEEDGTEYVVQYTDPDTGAESPIDLIVAPDGYTAEEYVRDCAENASDEWNQMLQRGSVRLEVNDDNL